MEVISLLCPTRGRPASMQRIWDSVVETASSLEKIEMLYYIDDDDQPSLDMFAELREKYPDNLILLQGPSIVLSEMWNRCSEACSGTIIGCCGDDIVFRTSEWDTMLRDEFAKYDDRILMVYGRDGIQDQRLATHPFISKKWVEVTGYFFPPYFEFGYNDAWITDVAARIKRIQYLPEFYTEHMHPAVNKAEWDVTYRNRLGLVNENRLLFVQLTPKRMEDVTKLADYIKEKAQ